MKPNYEEVIDKLQSFGGDVAIVVDLSWCLFNDAALECLKELPEFKSCTSAIPKSATSVWSTSRICSNWRHWTSAALRSATRVWNTSKICPNSENSISVKPR